MKRAHALVAVISFAAASFILLWSLTHLGGTGSAKSDYYVRDVVVVTDRMWQPDELEDKENFAIDQLDGRATEVGTESGSDNKEDVAHSDSYGAIVPLAGNNESAQSDSLWEAEEEQTTVVDDGPSTSEVIVNGGGGSRILDEVEYVVVD